jgi:hypothetical protein
MDKMIVYCGLDCMQCPAYLATQKNDRKEIEQVAKNWSTTSMIFTPDEIYCDGCNVEGRIFSWCEKCPIRICCRKKGFENCAYCDDYICDKLQNILDKSPSAKKNLEEIREKIKK